MLILGYWIIVQHLQIEQSWSWNRTKIVCIVGGVDSLISRAIECSIIEWILCNGKENNINVQHLENLRVKNIVIFIRLDTNILFLFKENAFFKIPNKSEKYEFPKVMQKESL